VYFDLSNLHVCSIDLIVRSLVFSVSHIKLISITTTNAHSAISYHNFCPNAHNFSQPVVDLYHDKDDRFQQVNDRWLYPTQSTSNKT
jgi:hypothetical protein